MLRTRVIPVLLYRNKGLTKTVKFKNGKYIGDPINAVKIFNDKEVDELVFLDVDASKEKRKPDFDFIKSISSECFMPLAYGGGISSLDDIKKLFYLGVEKVIVNTAALIDINIVKSASEIYGNQSIVVSVDVKKNIFGQYKIFSHSNIKHTYGNLIDFCLRIQDAGAGELIINSVDNDGLMNGLDYNLLKMINSKLTIPLVIVGGTGNLNHLKQAADIGASGIGVGSLFIYHGPHKAVLINYPPYTELKSLFN
tara:strand:+ start:3329 stop:4087 length:759 start_codon:yes stop_codon:yes gene_type:complete